MEPEREMVMLSVMPNWPARLTTGIAKTLPRDFPYRPSTNTWLRMALIVIAGS